MKTLFQLDKLHVRAPYHIESPCFEQSFSSAFDVGQFKQDLASTSVKIPSSLQVEVFTNYGRANEEKQTLTVRLGASKDRLRVGKVTF